MRNAVLTVEIKRKKGIDSQSLFCLLISVKTDACQKTFFYEEEFTSFCSQMTSCAQCHRISHPFIVSDQCSLVCQLTDNPLECSCSLDWFASYVKSKGSSVVSLPGGTKCRMQEKTGANSNPIPVSDLVVVMPECSSSATSILTLNVSFTCLFILILNFIL